MSGESPKTQMEIHQANQANDDALLLRNALERIQLLEQQLQQQHISEKASEIQGVISRSKPPPEPPAFLVPLQSIWKYRYFIRNWVYRDLLSRAVRSQHGLIWMILSPLAMTAVYVFAFSSILGGRVVNGENNSFVYPLYITSGLIAWNLFADLLTRGMGVFAENSTLMKKISFPRIILPISMSLSALITSLVACAVTIFLFALVGQFPSVHILWLPVIILPVASLAIGIGTILGTFVVFFRDLVRIVPILLQVVFWLTPIVYTIDSLKSPMKELIVYNPMVPVIASYRDVFVYHKSPEFLGLLFSLLIGLVFQIISTFIFFKSRKEIVDAL